MFQTTHQKNLAALQAIESYLASNFSIQNGKIISPTSLEDYDNKRAVLGSMIISFLGGGQPISKNGIPIFKFEHAIPKESLAWKLGSEDIETYVQVAEYYESHRTTPQAAPAQTPQVPQSTGNKGLDFLNGIMNMVNGGAPAVVGDINVDFENVKTKKQLGALLIQCMNDPRIIYTPGAIFKIYTNIYRVINGVKRKWAWGIGIATAATITLVGVNFMVNNKSKKNNKYHHHYDRNRDYKGGGYYEDDIFVYDSDVTPDVYAPMESVPSVSVSTTTSIPSSPMDEMSNFKTLF